MSKKSIEVSPNHGVNPSIVKCAFCDKDKGLALLGKLKNDVKAPKHIIMDYEPCDECLENWGKGVPLIECSEVPSKLEMPITTNNGIKLYPTGRLAVITLQAATDMFDEHQMSLGKPVLVDTEIMHLLLGDFSEIVPQDEEA